MLRTDFLFSIIKRLEEYDEFFPAFQSLVSQLYDLLGMYSVKCKLHVVVLLVKTRFLPYGQFK